jgi:putative DNA primase/helicase
MKPQKMPINFDAIPLEIKNLPRWIVWRWERRGDKWTKPPYQINGKHAKSNDAGTWAPFARVLKAYHNGGKWDGVGFMLGDDFAGFDWDDCIEAGKVRPDILRHVAKLNSYTEKSPSGTGLKTLVRGKYSGKGYHSENIGIFGHTRYFCITGQVLQNVSTKIEPRQAELDAFIQRHFKNKSSPKTHVDAPAPGPVNTSTVDIALRSNDPLFADLWAGDIPSKYASQSEADLALCCKLAFYTGKDAGQIDALFRLSGLMRDKWNRDDYRQNTIARAIECTTETFRTKTAAPDVSDKDIVTAAYEQQKGCADLFIKLNQDGFCYDHASCLWYIFGEHFWELDDCGQVVKAVDDVKDLFTSFAARMSGEIMQIGERVKTCADNMEQEKLKAEKKLKEAARNAAISISTKLDSLRYRKDVVEFGAQGKGSLGISGTQWDRKPFDLACVNGIVNLKTGELQAGRPQDYIKSPCPTAFDPQAAAPAFDQFLSEIFAGDTELVEFAQRVFGMGLIGESFFKQYLIILSGKGRNGKDTLISIIGHVLGNCLAGPIAPEMLLDSGKFGRRSSSGPSPDLMRLRGLRLAWASETSQGRRFDVGKAKMLTGGGKINARAPYGRREVEFEQSHLIFLLTNHRPHAPVDDYAFWKRICNIPFTESFVDDPQEPHEHKVDKDILSKLKKEAPGILRWLIEGCLKYQRDGLQPPNAVRSANEDYRRSEDTMQDFIDEECLVHPNASCKAGKIYERYQEWTRSVGIKPMSLTAFGKQISNRGFTKRVSNGVIYEGIGLHTRETGDWNAWNT